MIKKTSSIVFQESQINKFCLFVDFISSTEQWQFFHQINCPLSEHSQGIPLTDHFTSDIMNIKEHDIVMLLDYWQLPRLSLILSYNLLYCELFFKLSSHNPIVTYILLLIQLDKLKYKWRVSFNVPSGLWMYSIQT